MTKVAISEKGAQELVLLSQKLQSSMEEIISGCDTLINTINRISSDLGIYHDQILGIATRNRSIMINCTADVKTLSHRINQKADSILALVQRIRINPYFGYKSLPGQNGTNSDSVRNTGNIDGYFGTEGFIPLLKTMQSWTTTILEGKRVNIFDHPFEEQPGRICRQGSAYPDDGKGGGITGTCGCCACATIINKAGGKATEKSIVSFAVDNNLCSNGTKMRPSSRGGTSPQSWVQILNEAGLSSKDMSGQSLSSLSSLVEEGHGVIVGVSACTICPEWYGQYIPGAADGHAVVLESVIRDAVSKTIIEYVIADSNGSTSCDAARRIPADILEKAYRRQGMRTVVTDEIIW